jgi:antirestriction protein ArdC
MVRADVYQSVTDRIIASLEEGTVPWRKPWVGGGARNVENGRPYSGINVFLLALAPYGDPRWGTFKANKEAAVRQAIAEGREIISEKKMVKGYARTEYFEIVDGQRQWFRGGVKKDEHGTQIVLLKRVQKRQAEQSGEGEEQNGSYFLFRYYTVFNAEQVEGLPPFEDTAFDNEPIERAEQISLGYIGPTVTFGGDRAFYAPLTDMVRVPMLDQFVSADAYYSTLYHELVHSTGHESRLDRLEKTGFGTGPYAKEELVAEMGAAMLCGMAGIENLDQSAAYVAHWLEPLRNDKTLVVSAASLAQKASDLILGQVAWGDSEQQLALTS